MTLTRVGFADLHPRLFHMAELAARPGIERHGLLSVSAILDLCGVTGAERLALESERRMGSTVVTAPDGTRFTIRDQRPLNPAKLARVLDGVSVEEWLRLLNLKVFLWPRRQKCQGLLAARAYRDRSHLVLEIDTASLVESHGDRTTLAPINTGSVLFDPPRRGPDTFASIEEYQFEEWRARRSRSTAIAEVSVDRSIPEVMDHVVAMWKASVGGWVRVE